MAITIWFSTDSHANWLIDNTILAMLPVAKKKLAESDANNASNFHSMPDHLKKILYLDCPDIIIEKDGNPLVSIEISAEAGTGHNAFQRFARIAAAAENNVPAIYIYPEGKYIHRQNDSGWDAINPAIFEALDRVSSIYDMPALLYYYPSHFGSTPPGILPSGLKHDSIYPACPDSQDQNMKSMFSTIDLIVNRAISNASTRLSLERPIVNHLSWMRNQFFIKAGGKPVHQLSPLTATHTIPTTSLLAYLSRYAHGRSLPSGLLTSRSESLVYQVDANFRGDPYPGALAAIDYIACRTGKTFEERDKNLVLCWGQVKTDKSQVLNIESSKQISASNFVAEIQKVRTIPKRCLLDAPDFQSLSGKDIPRYYMQARYGCSFTKVKHLRVYSFFADAILFPDGAFWREG